MVSLEPKDLYYYFTILHEVFGPQDAKVVEYSIGEKLTFS